MRIYLLNPPFLENFVRTGRWVGSRARGGTLYYPLWLAYATGILEQAGHKVRLVDAIAWKWDLNRVVEDVTKFKPDVIVVETNFSSMKRDLETLKKLKETTEALGIMVGPPMSQYSDRALNGGADIIIRWEYDFALRELVEMLETTGDYSQTLGISYKDKDGKIHHNPNRPLSTSQELDEIPFVAEVYKKHLNVKDYFLNHALYPMVQIFTGRGCPYQCTFCSWPQTFMGREYRVRSVKNVADEFEYVVNELPEVKEIFIEDDTFTVNKKRVREFAQELINRGIEISWGCQSRADLDYETMKLMKKAGCRLLDVGYESGSDEILRNIKKGITTEQLRKFTKDAKKAGLKILADFVIGFPGETKETAEQTIKFIKEIKPDLLQVTMAIPIPGTEFYNWCKANECLVTDNIESILDEKGFQRAIVSYPWLTKEEIEYYVDKALKEYYFSFDYVKIALKNIFSKHWKHELTVLGKSTLAFFEYIKR